MLSKRLKKVADSFEKCNILADIGCDHGYLSAYIAQRGKANIVYASDISENSLEKARKRCAEMPNVYFFKGDGFSSLPQKPDIAVIAGIGGDEIAEIIKDKKAKCRLIMQPMRDSELLYKTLVEYGFCIEKVSAVEDCGRVYEIIEAVEGHQEEFDYRLPPCDKLAVDGDMLKFLAFKEKTVRNALVQAEQSRGDRAKKRVEELKALLKNICEVTEYAESK